MATKRKAIRSTPTQIQMLVDYMSSHHAFANGQCTGAAGSQTHSREWDSLAAVLHEHGPVKTIEQWRHTWRDMRRRAKEEAAKVINLKEAPISEQAKAILSIIEDNSVGASNSAVEPTGTTENGSKPCRCCLAPGFHRDLDSTYAWLDQNEVYSSMLRECFSITLSKLSKSGNGICDACVKVLRSAQTFRETVLRSEQELINAEQLEIEIDQKPFTAVVKSEPMDDSDGNDSDDYFLADAVRDRDTQSVEIKEEIKPEPVKKPPPKKAKVTPKSVKPASSKDDVRDLVDKLSSGNNQLTIKKKGTAKVPSVSFVDKPIKLIISGRVLGSTECNVGSSRALDKAKHRGNLLAVLKYSNVVPFKDKSLVGYICAYCDSTFPDPQHLRVHTETDHAKERLNFKRNFDMTDFSVKFDISNLNCTLCHEKMDDLTVLKEHLQKVHHKTIYNDIKDHMVQFRLKAGEVYDCAMCSATYETFKMLKQHMNRHYSNYHCPKCDATFASKRSLNAHRATHIEGSFKCDSCDKVFLSKAKKAYHEKTKHMGARSVANCPYCDEPFRSYYQRNQHLVKAHNAEAKYKCNVCSKTYILKSILMYHIKKSHLMERNSQCSECGFRFFSKKALKAHMVKHTGEKNFTCPVCQKAYARKYTLREHMRIHNNDRRFRCEVCTMSFVQKCSLKSHLLSNHGISMAASDITSVDVSESSEK